MIAYDNSKNPKLLRNLLYDLAKALKVNNKKKNYIYNRLIKSFNLLKKFQEKKES